MKKNYKILWLDDDFDPQNPEKYQEIEDTRLSVIDNCTEGILCIDKAATASDFLSMLSADTYDAVILDVRGKIDYSENKTSETTAFFHATRDWKDEKKDFKGVKLILSGDPFITGNKQESFIEYIKDRGIQESDILNKMTYSMDVIKFGKLLMSKIDEFNSIDHRVRNAYPKAYEIAHDLGESDLLCTLLDQNINNSPLVNLLARMRDVIEKIKDELCKLNVIPPMSNVNDITKFFKGEKTSDGYEIKGNTYNLSLHPVLAYELGVLLDISNDAHHSKNDLKLHVKEYIEDTHDANVIISMTHILISLLNRFYDIISYVKKNPIEASLTWKENFVAYNIEVKEDIQQKGYYYVIINKDKPKKCLLGFDPKSKKHIDRTGQEINPGDKIHISAYNNSTDPRYDLFCNFKNIIKPL